MRPMRSILITCRLHPFVAACVACFVATPLTTWTPAARVYAQTSGVPVSSNTPVRPTVVSNNPTVPASQPVVSALDDSSSIPKGSLGPEYIDASFGFSMPPLAGGTINRRKHTMEGRVQLVQFARLDVGWTVAVRLWESERPLDADAARRALGASLILEYPDVQVAPAEEVQISSRRLFRTSATFSGDGQAWFRQQAVIPLRESKKQYLLVLMTTPADDREIAQETFNKILANFRILRAELQQERLDEALQRGTQFMRNVAIGKPAIGSRPTSEMALRTTQDGKPVGFVEILEKNTTLEKKSSATRKAGPGISGLYRVQQAWLFGADSSVQYVYEDRFIAQDLSYEEWRNLSQYLPAKQTDPQQKLVVNVEGGIRDHDQLIVTSSEQAEIDPDNKERAIRVSGDFASPIWPLLLPRMVDLASPDLYAFSMYDGDRRGLTLRVLRVTGSASPITLAGRSVQAFRIEDSEGLIQSISSIDVDKNGQLLRLTSGSIEMTVATKEEVEREFGPKVKAAQESFRKIAGLPEPEQSATSLTPPATQPTARPSANPNAVNRSKNPLPRRQR